MESNPHRGNHLGFAGTLSFIIIKIVDAVVGLRVSQEEEMSGLDQTQHGESGYNFEEV